MNPLEAVSSVFRKYAVFQGRASRSEFWWFQLFMLVVGVLLGGIAGPPLLLPWLSTVSITPTSSPDAYVDGGITGEAQLGLPYSVFLVAMCLPALAVTVRRFHDRVHAGWMLLWYLVPILGPLVLLFVTLAPGTPAPNRYGSDPREAPTSA